MGCSPECRPRQCCDRTRREATSSAKSSQPATPPTPLRQEPALRQAGRPVGGKMQAVGTVGTFLEATKTWAGWTTALPSSMCSLFLLPLLISKWAGFCFISIISIRGQQPFPNMAAMKCKKQSTPIQVVSWVHAPKDPAGTLWKQLQVTKAFEK